MKVPRGVRHTSRSFQPDDRNPLFAVWPVLAIDKVCKTDGVELTAPKMTLKFILVLVGVGIWNARLSLNEVIQGRVPIPPSDVHVFGSPSAGNGWVLSSVR
ncbi:hypothetical protein ABIB26_001007 [Arthrobacter sp. UYEF20]